MDDAERTVGCSVRRSVDCIDSYYQFDSVNFVIKEQLGAYTHRIDGNRIWIAFLGCNGFVKAEELSTIE